MWLCIDLCIEFLLNFYVECLVVCLLQCNSLSSTEKRRKYGQYLIMPDETMTNMKNLSTKNIKLLMSFMMCHCWQQKLVLKITVVALLHFVRCCMPFVSCKCLPKLLSNWRKPILNERRKGCLMRLNGKTLFSTLNCVGKCTLYTNSAKHCHVFEVCLTVELWPFCELMYSVLNLSK